MSDNNDLRARFEQIRKEQEAQRITSTISQILAMHGNLLVDLEEEDVDAALAYLEGSGIAELQQHKSTWPETLSPHYTSLIEIYTDLKENRAAPEDIAEKLRTYLDADFDAPTPTPPGTAPAP